MSEYRVPVPFGPMRWILCGVSLVIIVICSVRVATAPSERVGMSATMIGSCCLILSMWLGWREDRRRAEREWYAGGGAVSGSADDPE